MFLRVIIISILLCSISLPSIISQSPTGFMDHIGSEDGLASQLCQNIIEDDLGNIWISSFKEVQKYDGHNIEVFELNNEN